LKPQFKPPKLPSPPNQPLNELCYGLQKLAKSFDLHEDFIKLLFRLQGLANLLSNPKEQNFMNTFRVLALCREYLFSLQLPQSYHPPLDTNNVIEICSSAALLYLKIVCDTRLRQQGLEIRAPPLAITTVLEQLKSCIEVADTTINEVKALVFWTLFLGGVAVARTTEKSWFVARLVKWTMRWNIRTWHEAKMVLSEFLWVENIHESPYKELWEEIFVTRQVLFEIMD
jgi:hypothetical protein